MSRIKTEVKLGKYTVNLSPRWKHGKYGNVNILKAIDNENKTAVVKQIPLDIQTGDPNLELGEIKILSKLTGHKNILQLLDFFEDDDFTYIVTEFCDLGDLNQYLRGNLDLEISSKIDLMHQLSSAVAFIHNQDPPIAHCGISLDHVLLTHEHDKTTAKLAGFGLASFLDKKCLRKRKIVKETCPENGSDHYVVPESISNADHSRDLPTRDVFALGLLFSILLKYGREHPELIPLTDCSAKEGGKQKFVGQVMTERQKARRAIPSVVKHNKSDDRITRRLKQLILNMTKIMEFEREKSSKIEEELTDVLYDSQVIQKLKKSNNQLLVEWNQAASNIQDLEKRQKENCFTIKYLKGQIENMQNTADSKNVEIRTLRASAALNENTIEQLKLQLKKCQKEMDTNVKKHKAYFLVLNQEMSLQKEENETLRENVLALEKVKKEIEITEEKLESMTELKNQIESNVKQLEAENLKQKKQYEENTANLNLLLQSKIKQQEDTIKEKEKSIILEQEKFEQYMKLEKEKHATSLKLEQEKFEQSMKLEKEKHVTSLKLEQEKFEQSMKLEKEKHATSLKLEQEKFEQSMKLEKESDCTIKDLTRQIQEMKNAAESKNIEIRTLRATAVVDWNKTKQLKLQLLRYGQEKDINLETHKAEVLVLKKEIASQTEENETLRKKVMILEKEKKENETEITGQKKILKGLAESKTRNENKIKQLEVKNLEQRRKYEKNMEFLAFMKNSNIKQLEKEQKQSLEQEEKKYLNLLDGHEELRESLSQTESQLRVKEAKVTYLKRRVISQSTERGNLTANLSKEIDAKEYWIRNYKEIQQKLDKMKKAADLKIEIFCHGLLTLFIVFLFTAACLYFA